MRYFCEVVETASATVAAERLHVVPAAVSMQLAQLEAQLGGKLFDRSSRPMKLTALGRFMYPKAKAVLADTQRMLEEARDLANGRFGWLSIGFTRSTIFSVLPDAVRSLGVASPKLRIDLTEILTEHQSEALRSGRIHVGLARVIGDFLLDDDMRGVHLFDDPLLAAVPSIHPSARKKALKAQDLHGLPYCELSEGSEQQLCPAGHPGAGAGGCQAAGALRGAGDPHGAGTGVRRAWLRFGRAFGRGPQSQGHAVPSGQQARHDGAGIRHPPEGCAE
ncbi:hypothetical protein ASF44_00400 [Pseudorhodoferax sp. Leaf274]|nr:hypothetical protein ASF44_00400 [Pseudorhodoferax sp. Leaf274]